jgi:hypothetical protein
VPVTGRSPRGRLHDGTSRAPDALLSPDRALDGAALVRPDPLPLPLDAELPRGTARSPPDERPLDAEEPLPEEGRVRAPLCPLTRCEGAASR